MIALVWIVLGGVLMTAIALTGSITLLLNMLWGLTFLVGGVAAWVASATIDVSLLLNLGRVFRHRRWR